MISFLKRKRFIKAKIIDHYLSNGRDVHQNYACYNFEKYQTSSITYQIYHQIYQLSSNIIKYHQTYHSTYHNIYPQIHQTYQMHEIHQHIYHQIHIIFLLLDEAV